MRVLGLTVMDLLRDQLVECHAEYDLCLEDAQRACNEAGEALVRAKSALDLPQMDACTQEIKATREALARSNKMLGVAMWNRKAAAAVKTAIDALKEYECGGVRPG